MAWLQFIIGCIFSQFIWAENPMVLQNLSVQPVDKLLESGIENVGALNLKALRQKLISIEYNEMPAELPRFMGARQSAYYNDGRVYQKESYPKGFEEALQLLATHEALGALNFQDENYQFSILLKLLSEKPSEEQQEFVSSPTIEMFFSKDSAMYNFEGGGATGAGGGGDFMAAWVKYLVTESTLKKPHTPLFLLYLAAIKFEPYSSSQIRDSITLDVDNSKFMHPGIIGFSQLLYGNDPNYTDNTSIHFMIRVPTHQFQANPRLIAPGVSKLSHSFSSFMMGVYNYSHIGNKKIARCGFQILQVPQSILESDLLSRSGGISPFLNDFINDCERHYGFTTQFY